MSCDCKGCKVFKDLSYIKSVCASCRANGGTPRHEVESSESIDRRNAEGFAITLRQIIQKDNLDEFELAIVLLLQAGHNLTSVARVFSCTRANVAIKFKKLRERCPHYNFLVDWTPHGGRQAIENETVDAMIEEPKMVQGELSL